jgi:hypothetical protein
MSNLMNKGSVTGHISIPSGSSSQDYNLLRNKPSIDSVTLVGEQSLSDFGDRAITNLEIQEIINRVFN